MRIGGDRNPLTGFQKGNDCVGYGVGLARSGRPLDDEVAAVQLSHRIDRAVEKVATRCQYLPAKRAVL